MAAAAAAGAAAGLPADRWEGEITAPLPSVAALLARVERLLMVAWVVRDVQRAQDDAAHAPRTRARARRERPDSDTSK